MRKAFPRFGSPAATRSPAGGWSDARRSDDAHRLISTIRGGTQYNERHTGMDGRHPGPQGRARRSKNYPPPRRGGGKRWGLERYDLNVLNYAPSTERYSFTGIVNNPRQLHQGRTETTPRCRLLIGMGDAEDRCFVERLADDLHGERQAHPIKSGADGNRRVAGHVEDRG